MKSSANPNAAGILVALSFITIFLVSLIVILVADVDPGSIFEQKVNSAINDKVQSKISTYNPSQLRSASARNNLFYELGK